MRKCTDCGIDLLDRKGSRCRGHHAQYMRIQRKLAKTNPAIKQCSKCSNEHLSTIPSNVCRNCRSQYNSVRWSKYSKRINRNTDSTRGKVREYQNRCLIENYAWLLAEFGYDGKYQCQECHYRSEIKEEFDLHHTVAGLKKSNPSQLIRRRTFQRRFSEEKLILVCNSCHKHKHSSGSLYRELEKFGIAPICMVTGERHDWENLEFHHFDPSQRKFGIASKMRVYGKPKITQELLDEISKCVIVKRSIHRLIHKGRVECPKPYYRFINLESL